MITLKDKILHCLQKYPQTRDSDVLLTRAVWHEYHFGSVWQHNGRTAVYTEDLMKLPREDHCKRIRAKIQNEEHKFLPTSETVRKTRKIEEFWWCREMGDRSNPSNG